MTRDKSECGCDKCVACCHHMPGWFLPGEAEEVAEFLGVDLEELAKTRLMADYWVGTPNIEILAPAIIGYEGTEAPFYARGSCTFLVEDQCLIHSVKPYECAVVSCKASAGHDDNGDNTLRREISEAWDASDVDVWRLMK